MKLTKNKVKNIIFFILIGVLLIPQTRTPIQIFLHKTLAVFSPSVNKKADQIKIDDYNWKLKREDNSIFNFESTKGKVVLVNFWATWCPPCIAEMPSMQLLYEDYKDVIEFVFISNEDFALINKFVNKNRYTFGVYKPISKYPKDFDVSSIPRTFLIDKRGNVVIDKSGAANWNSHSVRETIDTLLK